MEELSIKLNDLSDEILIIILKNLYNFETLYSLIGVNKRFNRIAHDSIFTTHLTLMTFLNESIYCLPDLILDRFCLQILPEIHYKIKWLDLESTSMERILRITNYPNLYGLGLYGIDVEKAISLFINDSILTYVNKDKILSLVIDISKNKKKKKILQADMSTIVFPHIFTMFINLQYLNFGISSTFYETLSFGMSPPSFTSSNLLQLHVRVDYFTDCLYLLDGRFNQLHTFNVNIDIICSTTLTINNKVNYFWLI
ncbi:unnamed protein product [Rotaria sp. Silwood1]|nr:unnamed protein product [Rotaria sp. Silwood1]